MSIIFLIIPVTLFLCGGAVLAFAWATRSGQFDDLETPAIRLLHDEGALPPPLAKGESTASSQPN